MFFRENVTSTPKHGLFCLSRPQCLCCLCFLCFLLFFVPWQFSLAVLRKGPTLANPVLAILIWPILANPILGQSILVMCCCVSCCCLLCYCFLVCRVLALFSALPPPFSLFFSHFRESFSWNFAVGASHGNPRIPKKATTHDTRENNNTTDNNNSHNNTSPKCIGPKLDWPKLVKSGWPKRDWPKSVPSVQTSGRNNQTLVQTGLTLL